LLNSGLSSFGFRWNPGSNIWVGTIPLALTWLSWVQLGESAASLSSTGRIRCRSTPHHSCMYECRPLVVTENSVPSENTGVPIIREIMVATTMSSVFVALFALIASSFKTRAALQAEILALPDQASPHSTARQKLISLFIYAALPGTDRNFTTRGPRVNFDWPDSSRDPAQWCPPPVKA